MPRILENCERNILFMPSKARLNIFLRKYNGPKIRCLALKLYTWASISGGLEGPNPGAAPPPSPIRYSPFPTSIKIISSLSFFLNWPILKNCNLVTNNFCDFQNQILKFSCSKNVHLPSMPSWSLNPFFSACR